MLDACAPSFDGPSVRSRYLRVFGIAPSSEALAVADGFIADTAARLGVAPPDIEYDFEQDLRDSRGCAGGGFTDPVSRRVVAQEFPHHHELVHAVSLSVGLPPAFFAEGLAEALSPRPDFLCYPNESLAIPLSWLDTRTLRGVYSAEGSQYHSVYSAAGAFTRLMLRDFGFEKYLDFYRTVSHFADLIEVRRAFVGFVGITIEQAIERTRSTNPNELWALPPLPAPTGRT